MTKTFQHLKQWQPTSIVSALSLESVRIASRNKVHKTPKAAVAFKTSFLRAKPKGTQLLTGDVFEWVRFSNGIVNRGDWLGMPANIKVENNGAVVYVESSLTVHNPLFFVHKL